MDLEGFPFPRNLKHLYPAQNLIIPKAANSADVGSLLLLLCTFFYGQRLQCTGVEEFSPCHVAARIGIVLIFNQAWNF